MFRRTLCSIAVTLLAATAALAQPLLRADITVETDIVTVGDMFAEAGAFSDQAIFRAPRPGTAGTVGLAEIASAAARIGFSGYGTGGLSAVRVARAGVPVGETELARLIAEDLRARGIVRDGMSADVRFSRPVETAMAATGPAPVRLVSLSHTASSGAFSARFALAGTETLVEIGGRIDLMVEMPHLARALPAGSVLNEADIVMRPLPARQAEAMGVPALSELVGMALQRQSREGAVLRALDVAPPLVIARNDIVTIYYRSGPMTLTVRGQALSGAAEGGSVQVLNLMSRSVLSARAIGPGAVELLAGPLSVAGL